MPLSPSTQVAPANGHCNATFANIKLLLYWLVPTLQQIISLSIVAHIMEFTIVVWNACLLIRHIYNWMIMFKDEECNQDWVDEGGIVDIGVFMAMIKIVVLTMLMWRKGSSAPMDRALAHLHETIVKITTKCTTNVGIKLCNRAISLLRGVASNIHHLHLAQLKQIHAPWNGVHRVDDGFRNSVITWNINTKW